MSKEGFYTSGEFAKKANVSIRTIRYYDKQNILKPSYVNDYGARFYTDSDFTHLQQVLLFKYLGFSLEDIKAMTIGDEDYHILLNSLNLQHRLIQDKISQMMLVEKAISDTAATIEQDKYVDWNKMLDLIHLTNMESSLKTQYQNANNIQARINLHRLYSTNKQGWFPWVYEQCNIGEGMRVLEIGCGNGALWTEGMNPSYTNFAYSNSANTSSINSGTSDDAFSHTHSLNNSISRPAVPAKIILSDISEGMVRDASRNISEHFRDINNSDFHFEFASFDCEDIPYKDNSFDLVIANHMLFYCDNLENVFNEVKRVLSPNGIFVCSTYGPNHMKEISELVSDFDNRIVLSAHKLYEHFGLDNGEKMLSDFFNSIETRLYPDELRVNNSGPLIEYILSCHGNQNQFLLDKYSEFKAFIDKKISGSGKNITGRLGKSKVGAKKGAININGDSDNVNIDSDDTYFKITKEAGVFICN